MATEKKLDETAFGAIVKEITAFGEMIRTHQDEKQAAMDEFDKERERYHVGKISKKALVSSVRKVNRELKRLDNLIRKDISNLVKTNNQAKGFALKQAPRSFKVAMSGISSSSRKK
ncbi:hypothetical protein HYV49_04135 [Candidatus Pacearchaeota archaeon]|nr:hypothetical protein [Candidatus Pacearchaeota archaeon]